jgi:hypothetical protein
VHEKEVQIIEKPVDRDVIVYRDREVAASASADPAKPIARAPTGPAKPAEPVASAAPTPTTPTPGGYPMPPVPGGGSGGGPGEPPMPGMGGGGGEPLSTDAISSVVAGKKVGIRRRCIDSAGGTGDGVSVNLLLDIQPDGSVASASPTQTKGDSSIGACLAREARGWRFPSSGSGRKVNVPFIFGGS